MQHAIYYDSILVHLVTTVHSLYAFSWLAFHGTVQFLAYQSCDVKCLSSLLFRWANE